MSYELIAILLIILCVIIMGIELIIIFVMASTEEQHIRKNDKAYKKIISIFDSIFESPTISAQLGEIEGLREFVTGDRVREEIICNIIYKKLYVEKIEDDELKIVKMIEKSVNPVKIYMKRLKDDNDFRKAYACRRLADFKGYEARNEIRKFIGSKNQKLAYNAAMALSELGDAESVSKYIINSEKNFRYSHRILVEMLKNFSGDVSVPADMIFEQSNDEYIRSAVIKAIAKSKIEKYEGIYLEGLKSKNVNMNVACIKALGILAKPEYEQELIICTNHKEWVVRNAAVTALSYYKSPKAITAVYEATKDAEWWVRNNASQSLIEMDDDLMYVESVLEGTDKYAIDAIKKSLYRNVDLNKESEK